jgi:hypothetical protein
MIRNQIMKIIAQRTSPVTGKDNHMVIFATNEQLIAWHEGMLIQDALPDATVDQREFLISGCTPSCWDSMFESEDAA